MTAQRQVDVVRGTVSTLGHLHRVTTATEDERTELDRIAISFRLEHGQAAFHEGDEAVARYRLVSGCVRVSKLLPDGRRHVLQFAFPGDFFGGDAEAHDATAEALVPSTIARFSRRQLEAVAERDLVACNLLRRSAIASLAAARTRGIVLSRLSARERLASFLLELLGRSGGGRVISLAMGRADIGDYLGLTMETVSRTFSHFKSAGLIRLIDTSHVQIIDARGLAALAAGEHATD